MLQWLALFLLHSCFHPGTSDLGSSCKHSSFTAIQYERCGPLDSCHGTFVNIEVMGVTQPASYRLISGGKADDQSGSIDSTGVLQLEVNRNYQGEYFLELKSAGCEPLMLEGIRFKEPAMYHFGVCLAKGQQLQRYKYLGENKRNQGVVESLN